MKQILLFTILILLLGCKATNETLDSEKTSAQEIKIEEKIEPEKVEIPETTSISQPEIRKKSPVSAVKPSSELEELIKKIQEVKNIRYDLFIEPNDPRNGRTYYLNDEKIKILLPKPLEIKDMKNYFDTVYLDLTNQIGKAYCEKEKMCNDKEFSIVFTEYNQATPYDWLELMKEGKIVGEEQFDNRDVKRIKVGEEYQILASTRYGLPIKVDILGKEGEVVKQFKYKNFMANSLKNIDFERQS